MIPLWCFSVMGLKRYSHYHQPEILDIETLPRSYNPQKQTHQIIKIAIVNGLLWPSYGPKIEFYEYISKGYNIFVIVAVVVSSPWKFVVWNHFVLLFCVTGCNVSLYWKLFSWLLFVGKSCWADIIMYWFIYTTFSKKKQTMFTVFGIRVAYTLAFEANV